MSNGAKIAIIAGSVVLALLLVVPLVWGGGGPGYGYGMMGPGMMGGFGGMWFMPVFMVVFWGLVVWGFVALVRGVAPGGTNYPAADSALEVLKRRYARGEITKTEFDEKKQDLV